MAEKICWYDKNRGLLGTQLSKARKYNRLRLIVPQNSNKWLLNPLPGNSTNYIVTQYSYGFICECQFFKKINKKCSHILAIELFIDIHEELFLNAPNKAQIKYSEIYKELPSAKGRGKLIKYLMN